MSIAGEVVNYFSHLETSMEAPQNTKNRTALWLTYLFLRKYPKGSKSA